MMVVGCNRFISFTLPFPELCFEFLYRHQNKNINNNITDSAFLERDYGKREAALDVWTCVRLLKDPLYFRA